MRQAAVQELARGWKDDPDTLPLLKDRAARDPSDVGAAGGGAGVGAGLEGRSRHAARG